MNEYSAISPGLFLGRIPYANLKSHNIIRAARGR